MNVFDSFKLDLEVIPGVGPEKEWSEIERKIELVKPFAKVIHIDLIDGKFVDNATFMDPAPFAKYTKDIFFELHMMVEDPLQYVKPWAEVGFKRFIGHVEKMPDVVSFVATVEDIGEVGLGIDGPTPIESIDIPYEDLDCILIYTAEKVGYSGASFKPERLEKVKYIKEKFPSIPIEIDGGVSDENVHDALAVGVTRFATTGYLFGAKEIEKAYQDLWEKLKAQ